MFRLDPIAALINVEVANLTKHDMHVSTRLEGMRLRVTITEPQHGAIIPPDEGLLIATSGAYQELDPSSKAKFQS